MGKTRNITILGKNAISESTISGEYGSISDTSYINFINAFRHC